jgi:hypothetical protein
MSLDEEMGDVLYCALAELIEACKPNGYTRNEVQEAFNTFRHGVGVKNLLNDAQELINKTFAPNQKPRPLL